MDERIRITVELIEAASGNHLWAEKFDRYLADLFAVQDQLVQTIVSTLVGQVQAAAVQRANRKSTSSLLAYECLLKGNSLRWDVPKESAQAMSLFMQATVLDPNYGLAYAALSTLHYRQWLDDLGSSNEALEKAHDLAKRAFELDSGESTILAALAESSLFRKQFDLAENYIARAVEVNPNNQWSVADRGCVLFRVGQAEEALRGFAQAREIDPYFNTPWYWSCLGQAYMVLERYENALASFESFPSREYWVAALTAACHARLGNVKLAEDFAAECLTLRPDFSIALRMTKEAFKIPADAKRLETSLSMSGLPK